MHCTLAHIEMEKKILEIFKKYDDKRSKLWQEMQESFCAWDHVMKNVADDSQNSSDGGFSTAVQGTLGAVELDANVDDNSQEVSVQTVSYQILMMSLDRQNDHVLMVRDTGLMTKMEDKVLGIIITLEQNELGCGYKIGILQFLVDIQRGRFTAMVDSFEGMKPTLQQSHIWDGGTI